MPTYPGILLTASSLLGRRSPSSLDVDELCRVYVRLRTLGGTPLINRLIVFANIWASVSHSGTYGLSMFAGAEVNMTTDQTGFAELRLPRGLNVEVAITGTGFTRRVTIPDAPDANLLDLVGSAPDQFDVARIAPVNEPRFS